MKRINIKLYFVELSKAKEIIKKNKEEEGAICETIELIGKSYAVFPCDLDNNDEGYFPEIYLQHEKTFEEIKEASEDSLTLY